MEKTKINPLNLDTIEGFARSRGKTRQTVYNWIKEGKIKTVTFLGRKFIDKSTEIKS